ncbi:MAG: lipopolysaccharide biosynthesis protein [Bacillota bacterium]|nr:lipopolysaccharide biosynthesis protein [Bacillota bacterium]
MSRREGSGTGLARRMLIYFIGNIATKLITLLLSRLQTGLIEPVSFGSYALATSILPQLVSIAFFEVWSGLLRFMFDEEEGEKPRVFANALALSLILSPLFLISLALVLYVSDSTQLYGPLLLMGIVTLFDLLYQFASRGLGLNRLFAAVGILSSLVLGLSQILFLTVFRLGGMAMIWSAVLAAALSVVVYESRTGLLRGLRRSHVSAARVRQLARFCLPLAVNATAFFALSKFNEFYISRVAGEIALSRLTAANRMGMFVNLFITVFSLAWQETAFALSREEERGEMYGRTLRRYIRVLGGALLCLLPLTRHVFHLLVDRRHYGAETSALVPAALLAIALSAVANFMGHLFSAEKRTEQLFYSTLLGAVVNVAAMLVLYPLIGLQAASVALAIGFLANFAYRLILIQSSVRVQPGWRDLIFIVLIYGLLTLLFYHRTGTVDSFVAVALGGGAALFLLRREIRELWQFVGRRLRSGPPGGHHAE